MEPPAGSPAPKPRRRQWSIGSMMLAVVLIALLITPIAWSLRARSLANRQLATAMEQAILAEQRAIDRQRSALAAHLGEAGAEAPGEPSADPELTALRFELESLREQNRILREQVEELTRRLGEQAGETSGAPRAAITRGEAATGRGRGRRPRGRA